jgi:hypothetical protein
VEHTLALPEGDWSVLVDGKTAGNTLLYGVSEQSMILEPNTGYVLINMFSDKTSSDEPVQEKDKDIKQPMPGWAMALISGGITLTAVTAAGAVVLLVKRVRRR